MKKVLSILLSIVMVLAVIPIATERAYASELEPMMAAFPIEDVMALVEADYPTSSTINNSNSLYCACLSADTYEAGICKMFFFSSDETKCNEDDCDFRLIVYVDMNGEISYSSETNTLTMYNTYLYVYSSAYAVSGIDNLCVLGYTGIRGGNLIINDDDITIYTPEGKNSNFDCEYVGTAIITTNGDISFKNIGSLDIDGDTQSCVLKATGDINFISTVGDVEYDSNNYYDYEAPNIIFDNPGSITIDSNSCIDVYNPSNVTISNNAISSDNVRAYNYNTEKYEIPSEALTTYTKLRFGNEQVFNQICANEVTIPQAGEINQRLLYGVHDPANSSKGIGNIEMALTIRVLDSEMEEYTEISQYTEDNWFSYDEYYGIINNSDAHPTALIEGREFGYVVACTIEDGYKPGDSMTFSLNNGSASKDCLVYGSYCMMIFSLGTYTGSGFTGGDFNYVKYPEVWEPYYETLALKIAAQAELEAEKMLKEADLTKEEPVAEEPVIEEEPFELIAKSERVIAPNGKDSVKITWTDKNGKDLDFDGYEIFRSNALDGEYVCMFDTENEWYYNTLIKKGEKYYYKVRGYKMVDGEKVYSEFSTLAYRTVK